MYSTLHLNLTIKKKNIKESETCTLFFDPVDAVDLYKIANVIIALSVHFKELSVRKELIFLRNNCLG